ncbi:MAG: STAS domain-containing protein [Phycisphaerae bacterium]|jgi:anti-sigma B factor antagonist
MSEQPDGIQVSTSSVAGAEVVHVVGEIDLRTSPQLRTRLLQVVEREPKRLVVDLSRVGYMDSSGVGTMVEVKRMVERRGGAVVLAGLQPRVRGVFEITQLDKFFIIAGSVDEATGK